MDVTKEDWLGEGMHAAINRELDRIERRSGPDFTPTFERDLAFNVAVLAMQAFSARGNTIGGTMLVKELQDKLGFSAALTTAQSEAAELRKEVERLRGATDRIQKRYSEWQKAIADWDGSLSMSKAQADAIACEMEWVDYTIRAALKETQHER